MRPVEGQTTLVTGASSGIGAQMAIVMGAAGAKVGVNYPFDKEPVDRVAGAITGAGGEAIVLQADVSREDQVVKMDMVDEVDPGDVMDAGPAPSRPQCPLFPQRPSGSWLFFTEHRR